MEDESSSNCLQVRKNSSGDALLINVSVCEELNLAPTEEWFQTATWSSQQAITGSAKGRGSTLFIRHHDHDLVLRHYCRGGLVGRFNRDFFLYQQLHNTRPHQELNLLNYMREQGLKVPVGVAGLVSHTLFGYRADILFKRIPNAEDVHTLLLSNALTEDNWHSIGKAIKAMHNAQVNHHDLNIKNIMLDDQGDIWLIDFDKCERREGSQWKQSNLDRLARSLHKQQAKYAKYCFTQSNWQTLLNGYQA